MVNTRSKRILKESDEKPDSVDESRSDDGEQVEIIDEQPISQQKGSRKNSNQIKVRSSKKSDNDTLRQPIVKNSKDENSAENRFASRENRRATDLTAERFSKKF